MKRIFITLLGLTLSNLSAQQKTHTVIAKENLYSISRKYEISILQALWNFLIWNREQLYLLCCQMQEVWQTELWKITARI